MSSQMRKNISYQKVLRLLCLAVAVFCGISLLGDVAAWIICRFDGISFGVSSASTIGIIGGADGPTAIFVTAAASPGWLTSGKLLVLMISLLGWRYFKRKT